MEGKRYSLEKAQEEAHKLTENVKSGGASSYAEAERQFKQSAQRPISPERMGGYFDILEPSAAWEHGRKKKEINYTIDAYKKNPSKEIEEAAIQSIAKSMATAGGIKYAIYLQKNLQLPAEAIQRSSELQSAIKQYFSNIPNLDFSSRFSSSGPDFYYVENLTTVIDLFPLPESFWQSEEFQEGLRNFWIVKEPAIWDSEGQVISPLFMEKVPDTTYEEYVFSEKKVISFISNLSRLVNVVFPDPKLFITDDHVQAKAKSLLAIPIEGYDYERERKFSLKRIELAAVAEVASFFQIKKDDPKIQSLVPLIEKGVLGTLDKHMKYCGEALRALEALGFSKEVVDNIGKEGMLYKIDHDYTQDNKNTKIIKEAFGFPESIWADLFEMAIKKGMWREVRKLSRDFPECKGLYSETLARNKQIILTSQDARERKEAIEVYVGLIEAGDQKYFADFINIVLERSKDHEPKDTKTGFTPIQEAAFAVLYRLDYPESNAALFSLFSNETIPSVVKRSILTKLTKEDVSSSSSVDKRPSARLRGWLRKQKLEDVNWNDLSFLKEIENISAGESRKVAKLYANEIIAGFGANKMSSYEVWKKQYPDIPQDAFLQICKFLQANPREEEWQSYRPDVMEKFQILYQSLRRESNRRDTLLSAVISCHDIPPELLDLVIGKLSDINFGKKEDADKISRILKLTTFLNFVQKIIRQNEYPEDDGGGYYDDEDEGYVELKDENYIPDNIRAIFSQSITNLSELESLLSEVASAQIQEILPNEQITAEKVEKVIEQWADIEPIFTYLKRHPNLKTYIAEMFANFDSKEHWKEWRYNLKNKEVKKQVGHLSPEQLEVWQNDSIAEVGDFEAQEGSSSKAEQVRRILVDAVVRDRHINNEQAEGVRLPFAQRILEKALFALDEDPEQGKRNLVEVVKEVNDLASKLDILILSANSSRVGQTLDTILPPEKNLTPSSKIENSLKALRPFLPLEIFETIWQTYKSIPDKTTISSNVLISPEVRQALTLKLQDIKQHAGEIFSSNIWQELGLPNSTAPEISIIYQKRAEIKAVLEILKLADLGSRQIALNILTEGKKKEEGSSLTSAIDNLKKVFKDCAFMQDIKNVEFVIKEQTQLIGKRRLAMVLSDNPSFLWQAGKYPVGNGSCQHYAEGSMSQSLMGYVGDAHIKVAYLFDINSLPDDLKTKLQEGSPLGEVINQAKPPEVLQAVVARSIVKVGKDKQNKPAVFMEPTYSVINKGDLSMDRYFNLFTDLFVAEPMNSKLYRGAGEEKIGIPPSRNPAGQYEDGAEGNAGNVGMGIQTSSYTIGAKLISKEHIPTSEEEQIIEKMRRSSM